MISLLQEIELTKTGILPSLVSDYINGKDAISSLINYPFQFSAFSEVIADKAKDNIDRKLLVDVLQTQYSYLPPSAIVTANIQSLLSENTFTVTAAHQPCLFMGPLYNIYKISCAINVAQQLKGHFPDYNFVPVFWMGSEDHDVDELNHTFINGKRLEWKDSGKGAAGRWNTDTMQDAIEELKSVISNTEIISVLEEGLKKYETFGRFTQYFVNEIFKNQGLVVLDQDDVQLKSQFSQVIKDEVLNSRAVEVLKANVEFLETNYKAQAKPRDINFFYLGDGFRERIVLNPSSNKFEVNNTSISFSREEVFAEIENHPERFSPNVIYRPLYQETVLPNLAFVGGAGELSYWLELKPLFDYYKVNYPMQVMRNSAVIVNASVLKKLEKLNLQVEDFFGDIEQLINRYVQQNMHADADLAAEKKKVEELYETVLAKAGAADVTLRNNALAEKQKTISSLENLEAKILKAEKRKQETAVNQIRSVHAALFPEGNLQERRENFIPYLNQDFVPFLVETLNPFSKSFKVISV
ncbi:MAG: bacillithiol biosynthesis cysteine-adding enzyme BshC [Bacteroidota bacterium]